MVSHCTQKNMKKIYYIPVILALIAIVTFGQGKGDFFGIKAAFGYAGGEDTTDPTILSLIYGMTANTVEVTFDEELQNIADGHHPDVSDFDVYNSNNDDVSYVVSGVSYSNVTDIVTITLTNSIQSEDSPRIYISSQLWSLVDLAGNYFNAGNSYDAPVEVWHQLFPKKQLLVQQLLHSLSHGQLITMQPVV